ncbi:hypothetical protein [Streptomyces amakusaensis]|uniref:Uncharacterized protein n=1 Tax=Streptomyces amakusaensis TaxID=67271 RepID=A0ABW0ANA7_9ACTN
MTMNGDTSAESSAVASFASDQRRDAYIRAMGRLEAGREPGGRVRVYIGAPSGITDRKGWRWRFTEIRKALPADVRLPRFSTVFGDRSDGQREYERDWETYFAGLDGLVLVGYRSQSGLLRVRLGPVARRELLAVVPSGRPVFVHAWEMGLVPLVDCDPVKTVTGPEGKERLSLTIPPAWTPQAATLQAALAALTPKPAPEEAEAEASGIPASRGAGTAQAAGLAVLA